MRLDATKMFKHQKKNTLGNVFFIERCVCVADDKLMKNVRMMNKQLMIHQSMTIVNLIVIGKL